LADEVNAAMPAHVVALVADALNDDARALRGSRVLLLGITYKPDVADLRESPPLEVLRLLRAKGADAAYHDPHVPALELEGARLASATLDDAALREADCVVIATHHRAYDWAWVAKYARVIVDTRNVLAGIPTTARVVKL
ncbi:MAG TPA: UDP binding domain-containing protein, partial [Thermomicrobiales bacterium]